jgi:hypothetical protein
MPSHRGLTATKNQSLMSILSRHHGFAATKNQSLMSMPSRHHRIFYSKNILSVTITLLKLEQHY